MTRPFTNRRLVGFIAAVMLAVAGIAASTAGARPIETGPGGLPVFNVQTSIAKPTAVAAPAGGVTSSTDGFDYGAAAVGAGVIAAAALLIGAGSLTIRRRSQPEHT